MASDDPTARLSAVLAESEYRDLADRLAEVAVDLRDRSGMDQRTMFTLFNRALSAADEDDDLVRDALEVVIDRISGWCEPHRRIFPEP
ncbi:hypothetical protein [Microbacterium sp. ZW T5_56]|uniref:hypothetical protein n=1 Tax=Microbacterium sp. ZW T5_56 TaxID=3378081 RepID=UPI003853AD7A